MLLQMNDAAGKIVLIGATNHPWAMNAAFLRRFDRRVLVDLPTKDDRAEIMRRVLGFDVDDECLKASEGFSGADVSVAAHKARSDVAIRVMRRGRFIAGSNGKLVPCDCDGATCDHTFPATTPATCVEFPPVTRADVLAALKSSGSATPPETLLRIRNWDGDR